MTRPIRDLARSVRQRLTILAKERNRPFGELLQYFAIERFLYRLGTSAYRDRFVLKGAMMLIAWPTMDIDLLGRLPNHLRQDPVRGPAPHRSCEQGQEMVGSES